MSDHSSLARRWAKEAIEACRAEVFTELVTSEVVDHSGPAPVTGTASFIGRTQAMHAAFGELKIESDDLISDPDRFAWRWTMTGVHRGDFMGIAATGVRISVSGINIQRVVGGRSAEHWSNSDMLGLMKQLQPKR